MIFSASATCPRSLRNSKSDLSFCFTILTRYCYTSNTDHQQPFVLLEIGTYCGYSLIRMAIVLLAALGTDFHVITVDVDPRNIAVARELVELAGFSAHVSFVCLTRNQPDELSARTSAVVREIRPADKAPRFDFVFIDHEKDLYLPDLRQLEQSRLVRAGTFVAADNVVFFGLDDYLAHVQGLASQGIATTELAIGRLEYLNDEVTVGDRSLVDGIELTIYKEDQ